MYVPSASQTKTPPDVTDDERVAKTMDKLSVNFGVEILTLVKGYVSTEVDARLSFDTEATLARARNIISLYEAAGERRYRGAGGMYIAAAVGG